MVVLGEVEAGGEKKKEEKKERACEKGEEDQGYRTTCGLEEKKSISEERLKPSSRIGAYSL